MSFNTEIRRRDDLMRAPRCVLFVEDNPDDYSMAVHELAKIQLRNRVMRVATADELLLHLRGVFQYLDRHKYPLPAVILLDLHLPNSDTLEAHTMLRSDLKFRRIPLITISDPIHLRLLERTVELGADAWMTKPFRSAEFARLAHEVKLQLEFGIEQLTVCDTASDSSSPPARF